MRVVVVGGGVIGQAAAWRLAGSGTRVTIVDPAPGGGASRAAAGMLAPVAEAGPGEEIVLALNLAAAARWPGFAAELAAAAGRDPGYTTNGTLVVARDRDDLGSLDDIARQHEAAGLRSLRVGSREARRLEPALAPTVRGGLWLPEDHQVDNRLLLDALSRANLRAGVAFVREQARCVTARSVETAGGVRLDADAVVVATGAWPAPVLLGDGERGEEGGEDGGDAGTVPVRPVKGQILRVRATAGAVFPTRTVRGADVYVVPREHGEIVIGATVEEKGWDTTVTAGAVLDLLRAAWELLPGLAEAAFTEAMAGLRPGTPDNVPLIGRLSPDGPVLATGHHRHGVLLSPLTADLVAHLVLGAAVPGPADPARFLAACDPARPAVWAAARTGLRGGPAGERGDRAEPVGRSAPAVGTEEHRDRNGAREEAHAGRKPVGRSRPGWAT
jgi:glycine oxidase